MANAILLISCKDQKGITAAITHFVASHGGNIIHADQHIDAQSNTFFMRVEWSLAGFELSREQLCMHFEAIAQRFAMIWECGFSDERQRMAIFVSKHLHCLYDVLLRYREGQLNCEIPLIISNHEAAALVAKNFDIAFEYMPICKENKLDQERQELVLLKRHQIDVIALARYHQILTSMMIEPFLNRIINIHHSFLPAFAGGAPYAQAYRKGVKIIGATSHYVTAELDQGPIIEQDITRISHRDAVDDLKRMGQDLEKMVFSRALRLHLERKILCYDNKTVVFD